MTPHDLRAAGAAAVATLLGACALFPVFSSAAWLPPVLAAVLVVLAGGLLLRTGGPAGWAGLTGGRAVPRVVRAAGVALVPLAQLFLVVCLLTALFAPRHAFLGVLPTPTSLGELGQVVREGTAEMQEQATPALPLTGLVVLTALFVALLAVAADLVAVAGRRAALAGVGLLVLYFVPVTTISGSFGLLAVAGPAAGFALLLWTDQHRRLPRRARRAVPAGAVPAVKTALAALAVGLVLGSLIPTLREGSFTSGLGGGPGSSTGTGLDPVAQLHGQLTLPEPIPLLRLDSSVEDPGYLRAVTLDVYDSEAGWSMSNLDGETSVADDDRLAPLPLNQSGRPVTATVEALDHDDLFLPVPTSPLEVQVFDSDGDDWRFDAVTGTVFGRGTTSAGLSYAVSAVEPRPGTRQLAAAGELPPGDPIMDRFTAFPELDPSVTALLDELTAGASTPYERVRRIHAYLSDRQNGFIYSLSTDPGTSGDDLVDFLRLKRGYCEQYAGAMAVLVRAAGVPARVALGYTTGTEERGGTRLITSDDAHAWVEAYFDGLGWVPFDPTPIAADRAADLPWAPRPGEDRDPDSQAAPAPSVPSQPGAAPREDRAGDAVPTPGSGQDTGGLQPELLAGVGLALIAAVLLALPAGLRAAQRRRRSADGDAGALWDELAATAQDLGVRLQPSWTPRQTARELAAVLSRSGAPAGAAGVDAVHRLARGEEAASYGPAADSAHRELAHALGTARRALARSVSRGTRLRALLWPASLVVGSGARLAAAARRWLPATGPLRRVGGTGAA